MNSRTRALGVLPIVALAIALACNDGPAAPSTDPPGVPIGSGSTMHGGVEYEATLRVMESFPVQIAADVTVTNRGDEPVRIVFPDGCVALLRAFTVDGEDPVWDQNRDVACTLALVTVDLEPGASTSYTTPTSSARDILGDTLPDGNYRITVYLRPDGEVAEIDTATVELAIPR
jgi:hypothetical protein